MPFPGRAQDDPLYRGQRLSQYVQALRHRTSERRVRAAAALGEMRLPAPAALEALAAALGDPSNEVRQEAQSALAAIGPAGIPYLTSALGDADAAVRGHAASALGRIAQDDRAAIPPLIRALRDTAPAVAARAATALGYCGTAARTAVPELTWALQSSHAEVRSAAVRALGGIGAPARAAVGPLVNLLKEQRRAKATPRILEVVEALGRIGPAAREAVPKLVGTLAEKDPSVRVLTAWALVAVGADSATVVPALAAVLDDRELAGTKEGPLRQAQAADLLAWIGPEARAAVPALVRQMIGRPYPAGTSALQALVRIGDPALPELTRILPHADETGKKRIALVLKTIGAQAVPPLQESLDHPKAEVRAAAARALGEIGRAAQAAVPRLEEALRDPAKAVRLRAAEALLWVDRGLNRPALQYLARALKDKDRAHRLESLSILADLGPRMEAAAPAFAELLLDPDEAVGNLAWRALSRLDRGKGVAVPILQRALGTRDAARRRRAIEALQDLSPESLDVGLLAGALTDPDTGVRKTAASALGACRSRAAEAVPALVTAMTDKEEDVRLRAIEALGRLGPAARAAVPALLVQSQNPKTFDAVATALQRIGAPALPSLVPMLQKRGRPDRDKIARLVADIAAAAGSSVWFEVLSDPEPAVRRGALEALEHAAATFRRCLGPTLAEVALTDRDFEVRRRAVRMLPETGREAVPVLRRLLRDPHVEIRTLAAAGLVRWPEDAAAAVPVVVAGLRTHTESGLGCAALALSQVGPRAKPAVPALRTALEDPADDVRLWAAIALGQIGPAAREAVPALRRALGDGDPQVRLAAADAWSQIERRPAEALPVLLAALKRGERTDSNRVGNNLYDKYAGAVEPAGALRRYGPAASPDLVRLIDDDDLTLLSSWDRIVEVVKDLGPEAGEAVPSLTALLQRKTFQTPPRPKRFVGSADPERRSAQEGPDEWLSRRLRDAVLEALGNAGPRARGAVPILAEVLAGKDEGLHAAAAKALARIGPPAAAAVPALRAALREREPVEARELQEVGLGFPNANLLCGLRLDLTQLVPLSPWEFSLSGSFEGSMPSDVRSQAAYALAQIGPAARDAVPALREALRTRSSPVFPLAYALWNITGRVDWVVPELVDLLDESNTPGEEVFMLLARIGPAAQGAVPALRRYLTDIPRPAFVDPTLSAVQALGWIGPGARPAVPDLEKLLDSKWPEQRKSAALALWRIDRRARQAVPVLVEVLKGGRSSAAAPAGVEAAPSVRAQAAEALGVIGAEAREAIPALREASQDQDRDLRVAAAASLWCLEGDAAAVPPVLLAALRGEDGLVPQMAVEALGRLGPRARAAVPAIRDLLDNEDIGLRHAAAAALRQIGQEP